MASESAACIDDPAHLSPAARRFDFDSDTFSYPNELVWEYRFDPQTGKPTIQKHNPPPTYAHHCFVVVRSAKQFFLHAEFEPNGGTIGCADFATRIREVVSRSPKRTSPPAQRVGFPGFANLRQFSVARAEELRAHCGGAWQSYAQRGNWRMIFPFTRQHQEQIAARLCRAVEEKRLPIVHVVTFPRLTINHVMMLIGVAASESAFEFQAYDPNIPEKPVTLWFHRKARAFEFPRTHYFVGGSVNLYEIYCGLLL